MTHAPDQASPSPEAGEVEAVAYRYRWQYTGPDGGWHFLDDLKRLSAEFKGDVEPLVPAALIRQLQGERDAALRKLKVRPKDCPSLNYCLSQQNLNETLTAERDALKAADETAELLIKESANACTLIMAERDRAIEERDAAREAQRLLVDASERHRAERDALAEAMKTKRANTIEECARDVESHATVRHNAEFFAALLRARALTK